MRRTARVTLALGLVLGQCVSAAAFHASFNKIRYRGGTVPAKVNPFDFNTTLTVETDVITLAFTRSITVHIKPAQVTALSYGQEAYRRVSALALSVVPEPPGIFGLLRAAKDHLIGIEYRADDGKPAAVLLEADKRIDVSILGALTMVTRKLVETAQ